MPDPQVEYSKRLEARFEAVAAFERMHVRLGNAKLVAIAAGLLIVWLSVSKHLFSPYWVLFSVASFVVLAVWHERVLQARTAAERAAVFYRQRIARLEDTWVGTGATGDSFRDDKHPYAADLDLFGRGSLFELLSAAKTPMGESCLAEWLKTAAPVPVARERQQMIDELRDKLDLREDLALAGEDLRGLLNQEALAKWGEAENVLPSALWRGLAALLALAAVATLAYGIVTSDYLPLVIVVVAEAVFHRSFKHRVEAVIATMHADPRGLDLFWKTLRRFEAESFASPRLRGFVESLKKDGHLASTAIRRLARIASWIEAHDSFMVRLLDIPLFYTLQVAYSAESWRRRCGPRIRSWIEAVGEMEALVSLAAYSYEHPLDPFPTFAPAEAGPLFEGNELGHPLIPVARCVRNSIWLDRENQVLMVSGSNMSGKSTFLRVVGVNAVLAMAGAPICGKSLRLTPLIVGTRLRTTDSLQENRSGFYSEILRIRQVFDYTARETPVLFLFDELLEGTNSKDRRIGAEGLLRALIARGAIGLVTTHDLALTEITAGLGTAISNAHLQDYVENGQMRFDYRLRPGVVSRSNALQLMRLIGLQV